MPVDPAATKVPLPKAIVSIANPVSPERFVQVAPSPDVTSPLFANKPIYERTTTKVDGPKVRSFPKSQPPCGGQTFVSLEENQLSPESVEITGRLSHPIITIRPLPYAMPFTI